MNYEDDYFEEQALFDMPKQKASDMFQEFVMPPFTTLDRRTGRWQQRKRQWVSLGIDSLAGRAEGLLIPTPGANTKSAVTHAIYALSQGTSIFDPVLAECAIRWFSKRDDAVLDPFAGGSVRGVVASVLGRNYIGIDLRPEQIAENVEQANKICTNAMPQWILGDSLNMANLLHPMRRFDLIFSCPPYFDLEQYSSDPLDLSNMSWDLFLANYQHIISLSAFRLHNNRFAVWVVGDVRDKNGLLRGLVPETIKAFRHAGMELYNSAISVDPVGTGRLRGMQFRTTRKMITLHQHFLVFVKGDPRLAAAACKSNDAIYDDSEETAEDYPDDTV